MSVAVILAALVVFVINAHATALRNCRNQPGDTSFPSSRDFVRLNESVHGRLLTVVPSAEFCRRLPEGCSDQQWADSVFRSNIPGAMLEINWEQDYISNPPSLCLRNSTVRVCGQGSVPLYAINATSAVHIQAGVRFAREHNLKVAVKASGHDYLGRSTAKNSLLLWTRYLEDVTFHDSFTIGGQDMGSAVTVGSGVAMHKLYQAAKAQGKIFVGGTAGNVVPAGGYIQGAGHSALSPLYGLAADNALEFQVVIANGELITVNKKSHEQLFWALRGGGAGTWGVIINVTMRTFPNFDLVRHISAFTLDSAAAVGQLETLHAQHIFDMDRLHAGQYTTVQPSPTGINMVFGTFFPNASLTAAAATMTPFLEEAFAHGFKGTVDMNLVNVNDALSPSGSDLGGFNLLLGSRLIPADLYRQNATAIAQVFQRFAGANFPLSFGTLLVAGGRVSENANIESAVNPKWRIAKTHFIVSTAWDDATPPSRVEDIRQEFTDNVVSVLEELAGPGSGSYSNEADVREPHFQTTFYGPNYARLRAIKRIYDPTALFIVGAGVGSEEWDAEGMCKI